MTLRVRSDPIVALRNLDTDRYWQGEFKVPLTVSPSRYTRHIKRRDAAIRIGVCDETGHMPRNLSLREARAVKTRLVATMQDKDLGARTRRDLLSRGRMLARQIARLEQEEGSGGNTPPAR